MNLQISLVHCVFLWLRYTIYCTQIILWIEQPGHFTRFPDGVAQTHVQVNDGIRTGSGVDLHCPIGIQDQLREGKGVAVIVFELPTCQPKLALTVVSYNNHFRA